MPYVDTDLRMGLGGARFSTRRNSQYLILFRWLYLRQLSATFHHRHNTQYIPLLFRGL